MPRLLSESVSKFGRHRTRFVLWLVSLFAVLASSPALAVTTDDVKWINQCVSDNADQGATKEVVLKYCTCMNEQMSDDESASITEWEKQHPDERKAYEKEAGWKWRDRGALQKSRGRCPSGKSSGLVRMLGAFVQPLGEK